MKIRIKVKYVLSFFVFLGFTPWFYKLFSIWNPSLGKDLERVRQSTNYNQGKRNLLIDCQYYGVHEKKGGNLAQTREFFWFR